MTVMLAVAGFSVFADEVLYFMVQNPTIEGKFGRKYTAAEAGDEIKSARVAAFLTEDAADYRSFDKHDEVSVVYLDLYYDDGCGSYVVDHTGAAYDTLLKVTEGKADYARASLETLDATLAQDVDYSEYSFAVELGAWDGSEESGKWILAALSETKTYDQLVTELQHVSEELRLPTQGPWSPGGYAAPEPTSGLLLLMGCALLGLKRRRNPLQDNEA